MNKENKVYQLALQGGGAKGSYHVGLLKALFEEGYKFNAVVGTSIGAMNAAMIAQNDFKKLYNIWEDIKFSDVLNVDDKHAERLAKKQFGEGSLIYAIKAIGKAYKTKGIEIEKIKNIIDTNINEEKLRSSKIDFGLLTVKNTNTKLEPIYIFKDEIPKGYIRDYILASARLPGFQKVVIDDNTYIDGGVYDNLPVKMLIDRGYKNIIAVRTDPTSFARVQKIDKEFRKNITYINPTEKPGRVLDFSNESIKFGIKLGYYDGKKFAKSLIGNKYYIKPFNKTLFLDKIYVKPLTLLENLEELLEIKNVNDFDKTKRYVIITQKLKKILSSNSENFVDLFMELVENIAILLNIERFQIISFNELCRLIKQNLSKKIFLELNKKEQLLFNIFGEIAKYI